MLHQKIHFFYYFRKVTVIADLFHLETLFPTRLVFAPRLFEKKYEFFGNVKNANTSQWRHNYAQHFPKNALLSSESDDAFSDSLAQPGRKLWPIIASNATIVASTRVEGF